MIQQELPKLLFKQFSKGLVSVKDIESLDAPMDCFADGVNVEINDPVGAVTRSPGYVPSESSLPTVEGYIPKYFIRFSVDTPSSQELLVLYLQGSSDFKIYINPGGVWKELTEVVDHVAIDLVESDGITLNPSVAHASEDGYYNNCFMRNLSTGNVAFVRLHQSSKLYTVEDLSFTPAWVASNYCNIYRNSLSAFTTSLSDITAFSFLQLLGKLRIGTGIGTNAIAQWLGYNSNVIKVLNGSDSKDVTFGEFYLEPLNKRPDTIEVVADGGPFTSVQVVITAVDAEGQEVVVAKACKGLPAPGSEYIAALDSGTLKVSINMSFRSLLMRFTGFNIYANSNLSEYTYFLQGSYLFVDTPLKIAEDSTNTLRAHFSATYTSSGRQLYCSPLIDSEAKFSVIKYHKGRVYIGGIEGQDYIRFTQFNTDAGEIRDFFAYELVSGFGYFIVASGSADKNVGLAISKDGNLIVFKNNSTYAYGIQDSRFFQESLIALFIGTGAISQFTIDDTSDFGTFFLDYRGLYLYSGGVNAPQRVMTGRVERWYQSLPSGYKDNIKVKYNRQRDELWILVQVSGTIGSTSASDYRILVYSPLRDNFKFLQPYHLVTWMDNNRLDSVIEMLANNKVQKWDYTNVVYTHDGQHAPEPYLRTHYVTADISIVQRFVELYAEYDTTKSFTIRPIAGGQSDSKLLNVKTFIATKVKMYIGLMVGYIYYKFCLLINFGTDEGRQQINAFGLTYIPSGGKDVGRK